MGRGGEWKSEKREIVGRGGERKGGKREIVGRGKEGWKEGDDGEENGSVERGR